MKGKGKKGLGEKNIRPHSPNKKNPEKAYHHAQPDYPQLVGANWNPKRTTDSRVSNPEIQKGSENRGRGGYTPKIKVVCKKILFQKRQSWGGGGKNVCGFKPGTPPKPNEMSSGQQAYAVGVAKVGHPKGFVLRRIYWHSGGRGGGLGLRGEHSSKRKWSGSREKNPEGREKNQSVHREPDKLDTPAGGVGGTPTMYGGRSWT